MKDFYTRLILTIIAAALTVIAGLQVRDVIAPEAKARQGKAAVQKVVICDEAGDFCAKVDETSRLFVK